MLIFLFVDIYKNDNMNLIGKYVFLANTITPLSLKMWENECKLLNRNLKGQFSL